MGGDGAPQREAAGGGTRATGVCFAASLALQAGGLLLTEAALARLVPRAQFGTAQALLLAVQLGAGAAGLASGQMLVRVAQAGRGGRGGDGAGQKNNARKDEGSIGITFGTAFFYAVLAIAAASAVAAAIGGCWAAAREPGTDGLMPQLMACTALVAMGTLLEPLVSALTIVAQPARHGLKFDSEPGAEPDAAENLSQPVLMVGIAALALLAQVAVFAAFALRGDWQQRFGGGEGDAAAPPLDFMLLAYGAATAGAVRLAGCALLFLLSRTSAKRTGQLGGETNLPVSTAPSGLGARPLAGWWVAAALATGLDVISTYADRVIVASWFPAEVFALYRAGAREVPFISLMAAALTWALVPRYTAVPPPGQAEAGAASEAHAVRVWHRATMRALPALLAVQAALWWAAPDALRLLLGPGYEGGALYFRMYLVLLPLRAVALMPLLWSLPGGAAAVLAGSAADCVAAAGLGWALAVPLGWGPAGAAAAYVGSTLAQLAWYRWWAAQRAGLGWRTLAWPAWAWALALGLHSGAAAAGWAGQGKLAATAAGVGLVLIVFRLRYGKRA